MSTTDAQRVARESSAAMVAADSAARSTGIRITDVGPGYARAALTVAEQHVNGHGVCHGGVLFQLADTAMAHACNSYGTSAVASGADIAFLSPGSLGDELTAEAHERALAGRTGLYDVTVRTGDGSVVAEFRGRTRQVPGLAPPPRVR
ncbi:MAG: hydroxyphenylacetyl-CoA thioesterase PaaI [Pseudonocardia sp.]|nr:hydroxyphenylacetyl-CoA thioesterase PaaI [Pseudonocardia sp.]